MAIIPEVLAPISLIIIFYLAKDMSFYKNMSTNYLISFSFLS